MYTSLIHSYYIYLTTVSASRADEKKEGKSRKKIIKENIVIIIKLIYLTFQNNVFVHGII